MTVPGSWGAFPCAWNLWPRLLRYPFLRPCMPPELSISRGPATSRFDVAIASPRSRVSARGRGRAGREPRYHAAIELLPLALREAVWTGKKAPDLQLTGSVHVEGDFQSLAYKADLHAAGLGPISSKGHAKFLPEGLELTGDCRTTGADLASLWAVPKGREAKVSGEGTWAVQVRRGALERWEANARLARSTVWGLAVNSATLYRVGVRRAIGGFGRLERPLSGSCKGLGPVDLGARGWRTEASGPQVQVFDLLPGPRRGCAPARPHSATRGLVGHGPLRRLGRAQPSPSKRRAPTRRAVGGISPWGP